MDWSEELRQGLRAILERIRFCNCGTTGPNVEWSVIRDLLERSEMREHDTDRPIGAAGPFLPSFYDAMPDASARWVEFGAKVIDSWGLTEHGGGVGQSWLTGTGDLLLTFLREFGTDRDEWPGWATGEEE